jgi:hypothetical protein
MKIYERLTQLDKVYQEARLKILNGEPVLITIVKDADKPKKKEVGSK